MIYNLLSFVLFTIMLVPMTNHIAFGQRDTATDYCSFYLPETGLQLEYPTNIQAKSTTFVTHGTNTIITPITGGNITKVGHSLSFTDRITGKEKGVLFIDWPHDSNSVQQYMDTQTKLYKETIRNYKLLELSNRFTVGNVSGASQLFTGINVGESLTSTNLDVAVLMNSTLHTFIFSSYDSYAELLPVVMKILQTVKNLPGLPEFDRCMLSYQYGNMGFRIQHPSNFIGLVENIAIPSAEIIPESSSNPTYSNLSIKIDINNHDGTIRNMTLQEAYNLKKNNLSNIVTSNVNSVLGGNTAYMLIADHINGTNKLMNIGTVLNNKAYEINFYADENTYTNLLHTVQRMIETFEIVR